MNIIKLLMALLILGCHYPVFSASKIEWKLLAKYDLKTKSADGKLIKVLKDDVSITGYMVPLDFSQKKVTEFLLVPYFPSCSHVPPPPANQTIKVKMDQESAIVPSYYPVTVTGKVTVLDKKKIDLYPTMPGVYEMNAITVKEVKN